MGWENCESSFVFRKWGKPTELPNLEWRISLPLNNRSFFIFLFQHFGHIPALFCLLSETVWLVLVHGCTKRGAPDKRWSVVSAVYTDIGSWNQTQCCVACVDRLLETRHIDYIYWSAVGMNSREIFLARFRQDFLQLVAGQITHVLVRKRISDIMTSLSRPTWENLIGLWF